jgi:hypothetical protein
VRHWQVPHSVLFTMPAADTHHAVTSTTEIAAVLVVAGGSAAAASQTDHTAPILAFIGALLAVVITAVTTNRRQDRQIAAAASQQQRGLTEERERLVLQLKHVRAMADLADLRALLDEAAVALHEADYARADVRQGFGFHAHELDDWVPKAIDRLDTPGRAIDAMAARLAVMLAASERVLVAFRAGDQAMLDLRRRIKLIGRVPDERRLDADWQAIETASAEFEQQVVEFYAAAVERAGFH